MHLPTKGWKESATPAINTTQPLVFSVDCQSGCHSAQNGWRLVVVEVGNVPEKLLDIVDELGRTEKSTAEIFVFPKAGGKVYMIQDGKEKGSSPDVFFSWVGRSDVRVTGGWF
jgi:hypothetical protein